MRKFLRVKVMSEVKQINDGGPAFPNMDSGELDKAPVLVSTGMSLRDWFAGQAIVGWMATYSHSNGPEANVRDIPDFAKTAYVIADALIAERAKRA